MERIHGEISEKPRLTIKEVLDMFNPKTRKGETALHNEAYRAGLAGKEEILDLAREKGQAYHDVVRLAFDAGKANVPDKR